MREHPDLFSTDLERALRRCASWHRDQRRRSSDIPYVQHPMGVALILDRLGFDEEVIISGLLHDAVEDTEATLDQIEAEFGPAVAATVAALTERKRDEHGRKRPWIDRKAEHLQVLGNAPVAARAVALADKLHNLTSILIDLRDGRPVWSTFHADRERVLWYYRSVIERFGADDPRLVALADACWEVLAQVEALDAG